jgi:hypothetical protein
MLLKIKFIIQHLCQATYNAFNNDQNSKYCGSSRYGKPSFFHKLMFDAVSDYQVVSFLYPTAKVSEAEAFHLYSQSRESWDSESNWIGYIAVTTDEVSSALGRREIYVAWRGTTRSYEWIDVLGADHASAKPLMRPNAPDEFDDDGDNEKVPKVLCCLAIKLFSVYLYVDTGIDLVKDTRKSPSLKDSKNPSDWHNLQAMLHVVAGWNGKKGDFEVKVKRSLALVNKSSEFLKDEFLIPGSWWVEKNKGLVRDENGDWVLAPPYDEDLATCPRVLTWDMMNGMVCSLYLFGFFFNLCSIQTHLSNSIYID